MRRRLVRWAVAGLTAGLFAVAGTAGAVELEFATPLPGERPGLERIGTGDTPLEARLLNASTMAGQSGGGGPSPFLAGMMSAILPGSGQLAQGSRRGWFYLGVESASWFAVWALRSAGNQAEDDFREHADEHWGWDRYRTETDCGEGLGPENFEEEEAVLEDLFANSRNDFYDDIGDLDVYACGWDVQTNRSRYDSMRSRSNDLFRSARAFTTVAFLNHVVSAIDAAKSASNRRREERALRLDWSPDPGGLVAVRVTLARTF